MIVRVTEIRDEEGNLTHVMCAFCVRFVPVDELWVDENGDRWDTHGETEADCPPQHNHMAEGVYGNCPACGTVSICAHDVPLTSTPGGRNNYCAECEEAGQIVWPVSPEVVAPPDHPTT